MSELLLQRFAYSPTETEGLLWLDDETVLHTLERPWVAGMPGGVPFESCVPDGSYELIPHQRPSGDDVLALRNPDLHVYYSDAERNGREGRYLVLIHVGNYVDDVVGCIAPGIARTIHRNRRMVTSSRNAMRLIMDGDYTSLRIEPALGTDDG